MLPLWIKKFISKGIKRFFKTDLININNCLKVTKNMDCVINLLGITGSPKINFSNPGSFMMSNLYCAVNLLYASEKIKLKDIYIQALMEFMERNPI